MKVMIIKLSSKYKKSSITPTLLFKLKNLLVSQAVVVLAFDPITREAEAGSSL